MVSSAKRPSGKGSKLSEAELKEYAKSLGTDSVGVEAVNAKYRLVIGRKYSQQYFGKPQHRPSTGLSILGSDGRIDQVNAELVKAKVSEMHKDLALGYFDPTLVKYGLGDKPQLTVVPGGLPPKPKLGTLEIWERYLEYKKPTIKETTFVVRYERKYTNALRQAIAAASDSATLIRDWLLTNRALRTTKDVLSALEEAYELATLEGNADENPYIKLRKGLPKADKNRQVNLPGDDLDVDFDDTDSIGRKAFTVNEVSAILKYVQQSQGKQYHSILQFLFLTGCRTSEAIAFMWRDVKWDSEYIVIRRSYSREIGKFVTTKTNHTRLFPMPRDGNLWNFLSSLERGKDGDLVFPARRGKVINIENLRAFWQGKKSTKSPGAIPTLIKQGKVSKYLPLYNTRHTFISYQINECGIPPHVVKDWCGHSERMTTDVYREANTTTKPVAYGQKPAEKPVEVVEESEAEKMKRRIEELEAIVRSLTQQ